MKAAKNGIIQIYLAVILGFFPLYYKQSYARMGDAKFDLFFYTTVVCLGLLALGAVVSLFQMKKIELPKLSALDKFMLAYAGVVCVSFLLTPNKEATFMGAAGWKMGFLPQIMFVALYFFISRCLQFKKWIVSTLLVSSGLVFIIGILHRFHIDPLNIYLHLTEEHIVEFLTTMGQATWYSGFLCVVFPIGLYIFYSSYDKSNRKWAGVYSAIAFMALVTQNSDSAFFSLFAMLVLLFYISFDSKEMMLRFVEVLLVMLSSFKAMGILQILFPKQAVDLDTLSTKMSQGIETTILLAAVAILYFFLKKKKKDAKVLSRKVFWIFFGILSVGVVSLLIFIILNTTGVLNSMFGFKSTNNYLLFDSEWGNHRGFSWIFSAKSYGDMSILHKIIGVGPDGFLAYHDGIKESAELLDQYWNGLNLTNAHNEYLTLLIDLGICGLVTFVGVLATGVQRFVKARKENDFLPAFALCIVAYAFHNFFCYQQVCATPFLFILIGLGDNMLRNRNKEFK